MGGPNVPQRPPEKGGWPQRPPGFEHVEHRFAIDAPAFANVPGSRLDPGAIKPEARLDCPILDGQIGKSFKIPIGSQDDELMLSRKGC